MSQEMAPEILEVVQYLVTEHADGTKSFGRADEGHNPERAVEASTNVSRVTGYFVGETTPEASVYRAAETVNGAQKRDIWSFLLDENEVVYSLFSRVDKYTASEPNTALVQQHQTPKPTLPSQIQPEFMSTISRIKARQRAREGRWSTTDKAPVDRKKLTSVLTEEHHTTPSQQQRSQITAPAAEGNLGLTRGDLGQQDPGAVLAARCAQCLRDGHKASACIRADRSTGKIYACVVCNSTDHSLDDCDKFWAMDVEAAARAIFHSRGNLPPVSLSRSTIDRILEAMWMAGLPLPSRMPWTTEFTLALREDFPQWVRLVMRYEADFDADRNPVDRKASLEVTRQLKARMEYHLAEVGKVVEAEEEKVRGAVIGRCG
ncbi:Peptidase M20 domain-containing protein-like protein [Purpureocillium lavendulum]|uniref:Peptidase M20 domain-containing protein-like protein n=1 Tax=Purpureocillium lavendulum TaxID=1247861 RepID=A0AB34FWT2_9HYPO|nr:Peptidase M20 domain-containing protein-like protein [Purpureocillium lavendulum]